MNPLTPTIAIWVHLHNWISPELEWVLNVEIPSISNTFFNIYVSIADNCAEEFFSE